MVELGSLHGRWFGHRAWLRSRARVRLRFLTSPTSTANLLLNCFPDPPTSLLPNSLLTPIPPLYMPYAAATAPFTACCCCGILTSHRIQPPQTSSNKALHVKTRARDSTTTTLCSRRKNTKEKNEPKILQRPQRNLWPKTNDSRRRRRWWWWWKFLAVQWQRRNKKQAKNLRNVLQIHSLWMEERSERKSKSKKSQWMKKVGKASKGAVAAAVFLEDWRRRSKWWNRKSRARNLQTMTTTPDNDDKPNSLILRIWRTSPKRKKRNTTKAPWLQYYLKKSRMTQDRKASSEERIMT